MSKHSTGKELYKAKVEFSDGTRREVYIKEALEHYIDTNKTKYRKLDGTVAGINFNYPRLLLDSLEIPEDVPYQANRREMTHEIEVIARASHARGRLVRCRDFKGHILTIEGELYDGRTGYRRDGTGRVRMASRRPIYFAYGVALPYSVAIRLQLVGDVPKEDEE